MEVHHHSHTSDPDSYRDKIKLNLVTTRQFTCGVTELNYTVDRQ